MYKSLGLCINIFYILCINIYLFTKVPFNAKKKFNFATLAPIAPRDRASSVFYTHRTRTATKFVRRE